MKKIYAMALGAVFTSQAIAQVQTETFEQFELNQNGYLIGTRATDTLQGTFLSIINDYNPTYQSWMGFAISNIQNNTDGSYTNQYASYANGGDESAQYAVMYNNGTILLNQPSYLRSLRVTNTTYAGLTMLNGDPFAKQFGSPLNAAGIEDGTEGADFFRLIIRFELTDGTFSSIEKEVYLADYRFEDDDNDYILNEWTTVLFPEIETEAIKAIHFSLESSDMGDWGMNNPAYFALDNVNIEPANLSIAKIQGAQLKTHPNPTKDIVHLTGNFNQWNLMDLTGKIIRTGTSAAIQMNDLPSGVYALEVETLNGKTIKRVQKL